MIREMRANGAGIAGGGAAETEARRGVAGEIP